MRFFVTVSVGDIVLLMNQIVEVGVVYCSVVLSQYKCGMEVGRGSLSYFLALDGGLITVIINSIRNTWATKQKGITPPPTTLSLQWIVGLPVVSIRIIVVVCGSRREECVKRRLGVVTMGSPPLPPAVLLRLAEAEADVAIFVCFRWDFVRAGMVDGRKGVQFGEWEVYFGGRLSFCGRSGRSGGTPVEMFWANLRA